ncbi:MAG: arsenate reductase (glutaredoxin) [Bacteroidota bacterium]
MKEISKNETEVIVYHNPRCSKSRCVIQLLKKKKIKFSVVKYLQETPTEAELKKVLMKLNLKPFDIIRQKEKYFQERLLGLKLKDNEWIKVMIQNPELIERPIIVKGNKAVIGRPAEKVFELF